MQPIPSTSTPNNPLKTSIPHQKSKRDTSNFELRLDILKAFGANLSQEIQNNLLFVNKALCYPVGHHIILRDIATLTPSKSQKNILNPSSQVPTDPTNPQQNPSQNPSKNTSLNSAHKNDTLFIYLEDEILKVNCMNVSPDNFLLLVCCECKHKCYITVYHLTKLSFLTIQIFSPKRRVVSNKFKRFIYASFSPDSNCIAAIGENKEGLLQGVIYDIQSYQKFKKNNYMPKNIFDLPNGVNKITYANKIICTSGKNHLSFWFLFEETCKEYKNSANINKNYVDHCWIIGEKNPTVAAVTEDNDVIIFWGVFESLGLTKKSVEDLKIERFTIKQTITNAFCYNNLTSGIGSANSSVIKKSVKNSTSNLNSNINKDGSQKTKTSNSITNNNSNSNNNINKSNNNVNDSIASSNINISDTAIKSTCISYCPYGLVVGSANGSILFIERNPKVSLPSNQNEYIPVRYTSRKKIARCTGLTFDSNYEILGIAFDSNEIAYCDIKNVYENLKNEKYDIDYNVICDGFHSGPITTMDVALQRPIIVTTSKEDKTVRVWNYLTGYCEYCKIILEEKDNNNEKEMEILAVAIHPNGYYIAISDCEMIRFFHLCYKELRFYNNDQVGNEQNKENCYLLKFSCGGHLLCAVSEKKIHLIRSYSRETVKTFNSPHLGPIINVYFHSNDYFLYSCGNDGIIVQYNLFDFNYVKIAKTYISYTDSCLCQNDFLQGNYNKDVQKKDDKDKDKDKDNEKTSNILNINKDNPQFGFDENGTPYEDSIISCGLSPNSQNVISCLYYTCNKTDEINQVQFLQSKLETNNKSSSLCNIQTKHFEINSIAVGTENGQLCLYSHDIKKYMDITDEKNPKYEENFNTFLPRWDYVYSHSKKVNFIHYNRDTNLLFSAGEDGVLFIYAIYEYDGDNATFEDNNKSLALSQFNSILDEGLGDNVLVSLVEMNVLFDNMNAFKEKIYLLQKSNDDTLKRYEKIIKEKEAFYNKQKEIEINNYKKLLSDNDAEKKSIIENYDLEMKKMIESSRAKYEEREKYLNEKIDELNTALTDKNAELIDNTKEYEKKLNDNENEHIKKFREFEYSLQKKFKEYFNKNEKLQNEFNEQIIKENKKMDIIETEHEMEIELRSEKYQKKLYQCEKEIEDKTLEVNKLKETKIKLEKKIAQNEMNLKKTKEENDRLMVLINNLKSQLEAKELEKENLTKKLTESEQNLQEKTKLTSFSNQLKNELYKKNTELNTKYNNEINIKEELKESTKVLEKQLEDTILILVNREKEMNKQKILIEELKNKWEMQKKETNLIQKDFDNLLKKIYITFQSNDKNIIIKGIREIYHKYLSQDADKNFDTNKLIPDIRKELENHIDFLQKELTQLNYGKTKSENLRKFAYQKKMQENSLLIEEMTRLKKMNCEYSNEIKHLQFKNQNQNNEIYNLKIDNNKLKDKINNSVSNIITNYNIKSNYDGFNNTTSMNIYDKTSGNANTNTNTNSSKNNVYKRYKDQICNTDNTFGNKTHSQVSTTTNRTFFKVFPALKYNIKQEGNEQNQ